MTTPTPGHAPAPAPTPEARIHDIGYRRYTGLRLGRAQATRALYIHSLRGAYGLGRSARSKILPFILLGIMMIPALVAVALALYTDMDELPFSYQEYVVSMDAIVGLYLALAAPAMVSLDLRYKTIPLYFSRPIERADYAAAKFAAMFSALFLFFALALTLEYAGALLGELDFAQQTEDYLQGLVTGAVFAVVLAAAGLLTASLTPRRGFGVAAIIGVLTVPQFAVAALQEVAYAQDASGSIQWLGLFSLTSLVDGLQATFLGGGTTQFAGNEAPSDAAGLVYVLVIAVLTAGCYLLLQRRYRRSGL